MTSTMASDRVEQILWSGTAGGDAEFLGWLRGGKNKAKEQEQIWKKRRVWKSNLIINYQPSSSNTNQLAEILFPPLAVPRGWTTVEAVACEVCWCLSTSGEKLQASFSRTAEEEKEMRIERPKVDEMPKTTKDGGSSSSQRQQLSAEQLSIIPVFAKLGWSLLHDLCLYGTQEKVDAGVVLFRAGDEAADWYVLLDGTVNILLGGGSAGRYALEPLVPVRTLSAGAIFGESLAAKRVGEGRRRCCSALVRTDSRLLRIDADDFDAIYTKYEQVLRDRLLLLGQTINKTVGVAPSTAPLPRKQYQQALSNENGKAYECNKTEEQMDQYPIRSRATCMQKVVDRLPPSNHTEEQSAEGSRTNRSVNRTSAGPSRFAYDERNIYDQPTGGGGGGESVCQPASLSSAFFDDWGYGRDRDDRPSKQITRDASLIALQNCLSLATKINRAGRVLRSVMKLRSPNLIKDRRLNLMTYPSCMVGSEMVDWLLELWLRTFVSNYQPGAHLPNFASPSGLVESSVQLTRLQAVGIWQCLLEHGELSHVSHEYPFLDKYLFYRWSLDETNATESADASLESQFELESESAPALRFLATVGPDALFRTILQKPAKDRSAAELELVYEELVHVKALAHLSTMIKRELTAVVIFEQHRHAGTVLFRQGDEGSSWYILLKGSVDVSILGKGVVCTLHEGDDFGKLALVTNAPRAATITLSEDNSQFLRVDKDDFNRILRDVEANTVRLQEHGKDVLVLERIPIKRDEISDYHHKNQSASAKQYQHRYSVMAARREKLVEYLLETRIDCHHDIHCSGDTILEDFLLTNLIFMSTNLLSDCLKAYYQKGCLYICQFWVRASFDGPLPGLKGQPKDDLIVYKRRVVTFLQLWIGSIGLAFFQDPVASAFVEELYCAVLEDSSRMADAFSVCLRQVQSLRELKDRAMATFSRPPAVVFDCDVLRADAPTPLPILPSDTCVFRVHGVDGVYRVVQARLDKKAAEITALAARQLSLGSGHGVELVEVKSTGERRLWKPEETSVPTSLTLNGRLFAVFADQIDALVPLREQEGPSESIHGATLELLSPSELAYQLALYHWQLCSATHESELVYQVFGRTSFAGKLPVNLDLLVRRFNEIQCWTMTEVLLCRQLSKRAHFLKKFVKIAVHAKAQQDLLTVFAVVLGLSNVAVSRLHTTWEKVPAKLKRHFADFESLLDPSRNHRAYRVLISKMDPPIVPFIPLLLKDLTFINEGNKTFYEGLVNFEKMHMIAQTLRVFRRCKSRPFEALQRDGRGTEVSHLIRNFKVIDNTKRLLELSHFLEPNQPNSRYHY